MRRQKFKYPPCRLNPMTRMPYFRHKWKITGIQAKSVKGLDEHVYYYIVTCSRCGIRDPNPPKH